MTCQVVSVANRIPDHREPYYKYDKFIASLARFGVSPTILGMGEWWGGLMTKPRRLREWLRSGACAAETLIVSDAYDVIFAKPPEDIADAFGKSDEILFNAEKGLFPRTDLAYAFVDNGTPWRYLNSGLIMGKPDRILALLEAMCLDEIADDYTSGDALHGGAGVRINTNDQAWYQYAYATRPVPMALDWRCQFFQTLSGCTADEFDHHQGVFYNKLTKTMPMVWHFNGGSKDLLLPQFLESWGL